MKNHILLIPFFLICLSCAINSQPVDEKDAQKAMYEVVEVVDGDTVVVMIGNKKTAVDFIGIDAPEMGLSTSVMDYEVCGLEATEYVEKIIQSSRGKIVLYFEEKTRSEKGNLLARAYGISYEEEQISELYYVNKALILLGLARVEPQSNDTGPYQEMKEAEEQATEDEFGIWGQETCATAEEVIVQMCPFVGDAEKKIFHGFDCPDAKTIHKDDIRCFKSVKEARDAGYRECEQCSG